jgi:hypothetical protein
MSFHPVRRPYLASVQGTMNYSFREVERFQNAILTRA